MFFDTFEQIKKMNEAGFTKDQSEAVVSTMSDLVKEKFVTKQDLSEALMGERIETSKEFTNVKVALESTAKSIYIRIGALQLVTISLLISLKFFDN